MASTLDVVLHVKYADTEHKPAAIVAAAKEILEICNRSGKFDMDFLIGQVYKLAEVSQISPPKLDPIETWRTRMRSWMEKLAGE